MKYVCLVVVALAIAGAGKAQNKTKPVKPECDPNGFGEIGETDGYHQYIVSCSKEGKIVQVENVAAEKDIEDTYKHYDAMYFALRSRPLTDEEMSEVERIGSALLTKPMQPFNQEDVDKRFNDAMATQYRIRAIARQKKDESDLDVPPREWDVDQKRTGFEWHGEGVGCSYDALPGSCKPKDSDFPSFEWIVRTHHRECVDKSRFLLMSEDGRWHCLALGRNGA